MGKNNMSKAALDYASSVTSAIAPSQHSSSIVMPNAVPDYLREAPKGPVEGAENIENGDYLMPRLAVCGKQTPQFDENHERHIPDLKLGQFFNSISGEIFGSTIYVVPLIEGKSRVKNRPYDESGPPYCMSVDGKHGEGDPGGDCHKCEFRLFTPGTNGKNDKPKCTEIFNYVVLVMPANGGVPKQNADGLILWESPPRLDTFSILRFKSTSYPQGQAWNSLLRMRNRAWYTQVYKVSSYAKSDGKNSWHIPVVENAGWLSQQAAEFSKPCYELARDIFTSGRLRVDEDDYEREPGSEE
jgi:hypothetical protein